MLLPRGTHPEARRLLLSRGLRAFVDGYVAILLPAYLLVLGLGTWEVGLLSSATLAGSALVTLAIGAAGHRFHHRSLLLAAAMLMALTGFAFAGLGAFWPLLLVAFLGTLNPSSGDVSVFLPLEHARLAQAAPAEAHTALFARYRLIGAAAGGLGALAAAVPQHLMSIGMSELEALRVMFIAYGAVGLVIFAMYRGLPRTEPVGRADAKPALGPSRDTVLKLAAFFAVDSFASGLVITSLLSLWLLQKFDLSLTAAGAFFFWAGLLSAASQLLSPWLARRIGLLNTMVFTHIPANACLILAAFAPSLPLALGLLLARSAMSQMDAPARSAFVMAVVTPAERAAAASVTAVPRSLAAAASPTVSGALLATGWLAAPLLVCGVLKIGYDLALLAAFRRTQVRTPRD